MSKGAIAVAFTAVLQVLLASSIIPDSEWHVWKKTHNKNYEQFEEEHLRYVIWNENRKMIKAHNDEGKHSYQLAMNHLGDLVRNLFICDIYTVFIQISTQPQTSTHLKYSTCPP